MDLTGGNTILRRARRKSPIVFAVVVAAALGLTGVLTVPATQAATAVIMGTTFIPDSATPKYINGAMEYFIKPTTLCGVQPCTVESVMTPEQFWPLSGWRDMTINQSISQGLSVVNDVLLHQLANGSDPIVAFGDSQSSTILTLEKHRLAGLSDEQKDRLNFVLVANPNRPNGGLLERIAPFTIPFIDLTASGATPTNSGIKTIDIACQYDGIADFPQYPLDIFADLNLIAGAAIHSSYITGPIDYTEEQLLEASKSRGNQQTYGDTIYITIPAKQLPLVVPLRKFGEWSGLTMVTTPLADLVEPTLRVLVELGYDRSIPFGEPAKLGLLPAIDPSTLAFDLSSAVQSGVHAALGDLGFNTPPAAPRVRAVAPTMPTPASRRPIRKAKPTTSAVNAPTVSRPTRATAADRQQAPSNSTRQIDLGPDQNRRPNRRINRA
ncbi:putative PE-PPE domain protein [uncultured Mycobacterium sp.]|uniref:Putative PE-PPE domain protein n=1 Tax=uncultured Mycobacterium sp. TaxID=171292 RepID=A0A1Y5P3K4_9MYCO|nr:putative PE-PPE domain protein [uncultured Mycobacterium sp.]